MQASTDSVSMRLLVAFPFAMLGASNRSNEKSRGTLFALIKRARVPWIACIAISIALHLAMLFGVRVASIWPIGTVVPGEALYVDLVAERPAAEVALSPPRPERFAAPSHPAQKQERRIETPLAVPLPVPPAFDEAQYAPSARLSVRPSAVDEISVPYPEGVDRRGVAKALLTLFIDEDGVVAKVKVDDSDLPPPFQESAKNAFAQARFHPGQIDDRSVKSRMRIEVTFESDTRRR